MQSRETIPLTPAETLWREAGETRQRRRLDAAGAALWSAFGSAATDRQRINLSLRFPGAATALFFHAGDVLGGGMREVLEAAGQDRLSDDFIARFSAAAAAFLEAAESVAGSHRTRLYLNPGNPDRAPRINGLVLEWKRDGTGPATEAIALEDFLGGRWAGIGRSHDPRHAVATQAMVAACHALVGLMSGLAAAGVQASLAIRTFEPPGPVVR